jgi:hypothetical protein
VRGLATSTARVLLVLLPEYSKMLPCAVEALVAEGMDGDEWTWVGVRWSRRAARALGY